MISGGAADRGRRPRASIPRADARLRSPFATYKRPNLLLHDPDRFSRILTNPRRPVQLVSPAKRIRRSAGQEMVRRVVCVFASAELRRARRLPQRLRHELSPSIWCSGVDVWINTPRRPWEACGTSGMKVLVNGGLNLSRAGWLVGRGVPAQCRLGDRRRQGARRRSRLGRGRAEQLYAQLEEQIVPLFYARDAAGVPAEWLHRVRESMAVLTPRFSSERMVRTLGTTEAVETQSHIVPPTFCGRERPL